MVHMYVLHITTHVAMKCVVKDINFENHLAA